MNDLTKNILLWVVIVMVMVVVFSRYVPTGTEPTQVSYSTVLDDVRNGRVESVILQRRRNPRHAQGQDEVQGLQPRNRQHRADRHARQGATSTSRASRPSSRISSCSCCCSSRPALLLILVFVYMLRQMQGSAGGRGAMSFGKSRARLLGEDQVNVTFADVAGVDEAKQEVGEIVDFLKDPSKFQKLGGKIPKGVLMVGSPGTGKTLLARAIAGEAKVPFFTISGSDFVEMFVGVGASRVRDMFEQAKKHAPCIIFIDEIDAVGRHRGAGLGGGHDEREQTLNQLLVEMDGFEGNEGIIVIAATNRPDVLDPALLRPGRFDRQVVVPLPDVRGREQILRVHMRKVPLGDDVKPAYIARGTPGFSGADLANLVNEAALFAARANKRIVAMDEFERAKDKIMMGAERRSMVMSEKEKLMTAYHEAGHAIVGVNRSRARSGVQGHDHPARPRAGRHLLPAGGGPLQLSKQRLESRDRHACSAGASPRSSIFGPDGGDHRRIERHRARHRCSRATWSRSGACRTSSARSRIRKRAAKCSWAARSRSTSRCPTKPRTPSTRKSARVIERRTTSAQEHPRDQSRQAATRWPRRSSSTRPSTRSRSRTSWPGKAPKPPADWDDSVGTSAAEASGRRGRWSPTIGSPAGQH